MSVATRRTRARARRRNSFERPGGGLVARLTVDLPGAFGPGPPGALMAGKVPSLERERLAWQAGGLLIGVDEAGRGPLAGPVVAAAVVFPEGVSRFRRIRDSKTLAEAKRDVAAALVRQHAVAIGVGAASVREIDRLNIRRATVLAMRRAVRRAIPALPAGRPYQVVLDGLAMPDLGLDHDAIVDGDALCLSIAAAGIIAKTVRDRLMVSLGARHPAYHWESNRGYGTERHRKAIEEAGPTSHHRRTFMPVMQLGLEL